MTHIESRPSKANPGKQYDFYIDCEVSKKTMDELLAQLKAIVVDVSVYSRSPEKDQG